MDYTYKEDYLHFPWGKVWYRIVGNNATAVPLLVLHGGPGYPSDYLWDLEKLSSDRQVIFYDQSGCGRSDSLEDQSLWTVEHFVEELTLLRKHLQLDVLHLLGHSWGTMLAASYMCTNPAGVKSIIFASPCIDAWRWAKATGRYLDALPNGWGSLIRESEAKGETQDPIYKEARRLYHTTYECKVDPHPVLMQAASKGFSVPIYRYMWGPNEYTPTGTIKDYAEGESLSNIKAPTLFTCGRDDGADPESVAYYASNIADSEVKIFEHSSHMPHFEEQDAYIETIRTFLSKHD